MRAAPPSEQAGARPLADIAHLFESVADWESRIREAMRVLQDTVPYQAVGMRVTLRDGQVHQAVATEGVDHASLQATLERIHAALAERPAEEALLLEIAMPGGQPERGSHLAVPLVSLGSVDGVLYVWSESRDAFHERHLRRLSIVATQMAAYVRQVVLYETELALRA